MSNLNPTALVEPFLRVGAIIVSISKPLIKYSTFLPFDSYAVITFLSSSPPPLCKIAYFGFLTL